MLHVSEVLQEYFESEYGDKDRLLEYGDRLGKGTVFKRLGYLTERAGLVDADFVEACRRRITKGVSRLDPDGPPNGRIVSRWNLRINVKRLDSNRVNQESDIDFTVREPTYRARPSGRSAEMRVYYRPPRSAP